MVEPYHKYPNLLDILFGFLKTEQTTGIRREVSGETGLEPGSLLRLYREMEQKPLDSSTLELCITSSGIAREMEQRPLDSSTLEICISSSGAAREMEQ